jgi:hypothetical protein
VPIKAAFEILSRRAGLPCSCPLDIDRPHLFGFSLTLKLVGKKVSVGAYIAAEKSDNSRRRYSTDFNDLAQPFWFAALLDCPPPP